MSVWDGFKSIFVGEDEIEAEEFSTYRPKPEPAPAPAPTAFDIAEQPAPAGVAAEPEAPKERYRSPAREQYQAASQPQQSAASARRQQREMANRMRDNDSYGNSYGSRRSGRNMERESDIRMATTDQSSFDLVLARPNNFKEVEKIGNDINCGRTVILNLELVKQEDATRILDFIWGVAFANDDEIKMMAAKTYAIIPRNVNFSGVDLVSELENNGYSF